MTDIDAGGTTRDTGTIARGAAEVLERIREIRASALTPLLEAGDRSAAQLAKSLNEAERYALIAQRHCVESLTARLRSDDEEITRLGRLAGRQLDEARRCLGQVTSIEAPVDSAPAPTPLTETDDIEAETDTAATEPAEPLPGSEADAVSHLDDDPAWSGERAERAARARQPKPEPEIAAEPASDAPIDHEPNLRATKTEIVEEVGAGRLEPIESGAEAEVVLTAAQRSERGRRRRKLVTFALVAIVIIGLVLLITGSSVFG